MTIYGKWDFRNKPGGRVFDELTGKRPMYAWYTLQSEKGALLNTNRDSASISPYGPEWDMSPIKMLTPAKPFSIKITYEPVVQQSNPMWLFSTPNINSDGNEGIYVGIYGTDIAYTEISRKSGIAMTVSLPNAVEINKPNVLTLYDPGTSGNDIILKNNNSKITLKRKSDLIYVYPPSSGDISLGFKSFGELPFRGYIADFMISDEKPTFDQSLIVYENVAYSFNSEGMIIECGPVESLTSETFNTYGFNMQDMSLGKWNKDKFSIITKIGG